MNMEAPDLNKIHEDPVTEEIHSASVPGTPSENPDKFNEARQVEFTPLSFDDKHDIVNVKTGNMTVKTFRYEENGTKKMIGSPQEFKADTNQVFYEKGFFYQIEEEGKKPVIVAFSPQELKMLRDNPNDPATQKMTIEKALAAQVKAIDEQQAENQ